MCFVKRFHVVRENVSPTFLYPKELAGFRFAYWVCVIRLDEVLTWLEWVGRMVRGYVASTTHFRARAGKVPGEEWQGVSPTVSPVDSSEIL